MMATASPASVESGESVERRGNGQPGAAPAPERSRTRPRLRRPSTPFVLRLVMALAVVPVALFAASVHLGVARNDSAVRTVGQDATRGITVAQAIKLNLAELDGLVVQDLLDNSPLAPSGFPENYNAKRGELHQNLVLTARETSAGAAYQQPLANIDYVLAHYHTLVKDAFAASAGGDPGRAAELYGQAHVVMDQTILPEADFVDKANTYVLNNTYDNQKARSASTVRVIVVSWVVLLVFLVVVQLLVARKFRRLMNVALALATLVAVASGGFATARLDASASHLTSAREQAFDSVHELARARATVMSARQSQGQLLLDPARAAEIHAGFLTQTSKLFRVEGRDDVAIAQAGSVPDGAGGYLATVATADGPASSGDSARDAVVAFGDFLAEDTNIRSLVGTDATSTARGVYENARAFTVLNDAIDDTQAIEQTRFDGHAGSAIEATERVDEINTIAAGTVLALVLLGLYRRLREYAS